MATVVRALLAALVATGLLVLAGVVLLDGDDGGDDTPSSGPSTPTSTPLASYDTSTVTLARAAFCDAVPADAAEQALGGDPGPPVAYGNGDTAQVTGQVDDVAHEFSCTWRLAGGGTARAWLFAPPVGVERAQALADAAASAPGCAPTDAPAYGAPSVAVLCTSAGQVQASFRGLFGDAWLTCTLSDPVPAGTPTGTPTDASTTAELVDRTGRWCVAVARAATSP